MPMYRDALFPFRHLVVGLRSPDQARLRASIAGRRSLVSFISGKESMARPIGFHTSSYTISALRMARTKEG